MISHMAQKCTTLVGGRNKPKFSRAISATGIKKIEVPQFYLLYIRYWNKPTFSRAIWAFGINIVMGPHQILRAISSRARLISTHVHVLQFAWHAHSMIWNNSTESGGLKLKNRIITFKVELSVNASSCFLYKLNMYNIANQHTLQSCSG